MVKSMCPVNDPAGHIAFRHRLELSAAVPPSVRRWHRQPLGATIPAIDGGHFMACTITSLIMFAAFGVLAIGFTALPRLKGSARVREDKSSKTSGGPVIA
jgi:hypothetical protein